MDICVVGAGYVGLVTSACFADLGHTVTCVDVDKARVALLNKGKIPIFEPGLDETVKRNRAQKRLTFTTQLGPAVKASRVVFICVGTPPKPSGEADLSYVEGAARDIAKHLNGEKVIVNKSTVPVGMADLVASIIREKGHAKHRFAVASCPEFLREGSAVHDFMHPDRIVIGADDAKAADTVAQLFRPLNAPIQITDARSAEMIKYASNAFLATKISFINEVAALCDRVGADVKEVARGMGTDRRIGAAFLNAGAGYGGSCFPKDTLALISVMEREGLDARILKSTVAVNADQKKRIFEKLKDAAGPLEGKLVAIWGLAFKADTDDMREAVSVDVIAALTHAGARVKAYDPAAMHHARKLVPGIGFAKDPYDAVKGADALLILTEWNEFKEADMQKVKGLLNKPVIVDGRNLLDPKATRRMGFTYRGVGRA